MYEIKKNEEIHYGHDGPDVLSKGSEVGAVAHNMVRAAFKAYELRANLGVVTQAFEQYRSQMSEFLLRAIYMNFVKDGVRVNGCLGEDISFDPDTWMISCSFIPGDNAFDSSLHGSGAEFIGSKLEESLSRLCAGTVRCSGGERGEYRLKISMSVLRNILDADDNGMNDNGLNHKAGKGVAVGVDLSGDEKDVGVAAGRVAGEVRAVFGELESETGAVSGEVAKDVGTVFGETIPVLGSGRDKFINATIARFSSRMK